MSPCTESSVLQLKLKALILDIIHNISVVKQLNQAGVTTTDAWAWKKQLRFYMGPDQCCHIHMVDAQFSYTYEYQVWYSANVLYMRSSFQLHKWNKPKHSVMFPALQLIFTWHFVLLIKNIKPQEIKSAFLAFILQHIDLQGRKAADIFNSKLCHLLFVYFYRW